MYLQRADISLFVKKNFRKADAQKSTLLFLHGFAGSSEDWNEIFKFLGKNYNLVALDLPGFGKSSKPANPRYYKLTFLIDCIDALVTHLGLDTIVLCGYSMGGRLALHYLLQRPKKVSSLILESASAGLKTQAERIIRKKSDLELSKYVELNSLEDFFRYWKELPLFASQKKLPLQKQRDLFKRKIKSNTKRGLSNSLKYFGRGNLPSAWGKLEKISKPVLLVSGSLDTKYTSLQKEMKRILPRSTHQIVKQSGHNVHLEKPEVFVNLVTKFLTV